MNRMFVGVHGSVKRELRRLHHKTHDKRLAIRCQIVLLWSEQTRREQIARAVGCSISCVDRVTRRFRNNGVAGLQDRREENGQTKLDESFLAALYEIVDKQPTDFGYPRPTWTQELMTRVMEKRTGVKVHPGTLSRGLKKIGARLGMPKPTVGCPWSKPAKNRRLAAIRRSIEGRAKDEAAVYLDEIDIHLNPKIGPDWMNRGKQKQVATPGQNAKQYLCGALDVETGRIEHVAGERKNGLLFISTLQRLLKVYVEAKVIHIVLDNFKIHSSKQVQAWMKENGGRIRLHFLPPYCPDHNRIERQWRELHANVTRNHCCGTMEELMSSVQHWLQKHNKQHGSQSKRRAA